MSRRTITPRDQEWPELLSHTGGASPTALHLEGRGLRSDVKTIAVVGSRTPTTVGVEAVERLTLGLVEAGFGIVSGLALGIDAIAHKTALRAGGYTIGVLGCGLDVDYPEKNARLKKQIALSGTLVTEYPAGTPPNSWHFPERNRIIAGISKSVLFVEGGKKSGGRITARWAFELNRNVFAVPGSSRNPMAASPNELIRTSQAALVTEVEHILQEMAPELAWQGDARSTLEPGAARLDETSLRVLMFLTENAVPPDRISMDLELTRGEVSLALATLEVRGFVRRRLSGYEISSSGIRVRAAAC